MHMHIILHRCQNSKPCGQSPYQYQEIGRAPFAKPYPLPSPKYPAGLLIIVISIIIIIIIIIIIMILLLIIIIIITTNNKNHYYHYCYHD